MPQACERLMAMLNVIEPLDVSEELLIPLQKLQCELLKYDDWSNFFSHGI